MESTDSVIFLIRQLSQDLYHNLAKKTITHEKSKWQKPNPDWVKLNTDGSSINVKNGGGIGGAVRDDSGAWLWGFTDYIQSPTPLLAELMALKTGMAEAWERRYARIEIETDSLDAWKLITGEVEPSAEYANLVTECKILLHKPWQTEFRWIRRDKNLVADKLAKLARSSLDGLILWDTPPPPVVPFLDFDLV